MVYEDEELQNFEHPADGDLGVQRKPGITYAKDFLLSFRELDHCKKLPSGFDKSILIEFEDAFHGSQDKPRPPGGFASQNFRRVEYGASPPTRRDASNYSRGPTTGKWESHSRDSDSQSDRDSESGRPLGNNSRRPWQNSEHDGLLGSGSSPKLTGYRSSSSAPKVRPNDQYNLSRSNAPYQPPRPYKAVPHSRTTTNDLHNDETFGSAVITSEDQTEEERKRRAEFDTMRKERYKLTQEKQNSSPINSMDDLISDSQGILDDEKKIMFESSESFELPVLPNASAKSSTFIQAPVPRPVIPPGFVPPEFANASIGTNSAIQKHEKKVDTSELDDNLFHANDSSSVGRDSENRTVKQPDNKSQHGSNQLEISELLVNGDRLDSEKGVLQHIAAVSSQEEKPPRLDDIFANSLVVNGGALSLATELPKSKFNDEWSGSSLETSKSKFAQWFVEDGKGPLDIHSAENSNNLFSLIGGGPSSVIQSSEEKASKSNDKSVPVLTCEDLEQSILSEMSYYKQTSELPFQGPIDHAVNLVQPKNGIDALASERLLSVLQKGSGPKDMATSFGMGKSSPDRQHGFVTASTSTLPDGFNGRKIEKSSDMGKNPTLEALFGSAFMKELQAIDAPVSTKRDSFISESSRFQLLEDENLITANDPLNPSNSFYDHVDAARNAGYASSHLPVGNPDRLGALSAMFGDGRSARQIQENQSFPRSPYDMVDNNNTYQNVHTQSMQPRFPSPHMSQGQPNYNQLDPHHPNSQMRFPESVLRHDPSQTHQFLPNRQMFNHPRPTGFEPPRQQQQQPMVQQQMQLSGNIPPPHLLRQHSGSSPQSSHPFNQVLGFRQELDHTQGFHIGRQQPGFGGLGMSPPGNHHPEVLQQLMGMEVRPKPKPHHPFAGHLGGLPNF